MQKIPVYPICLISIPYLKGNVVMKRVLAVILVLAMMVSFSPAVFADSALVQDGMNFYAESGEILSKDIYALALSLFGGRDLVALANSQVEKSFKSPSSSKKFDTTVDEASLCYLLDGAVISDSEDIVSLTPGKHTLSMTFDYTCSYSYLYH